MATGTAPPTYPELSLKDATKLVDAIRDKLDQIKVYKQFCNELVVECQRQSALLSDKRRGSGSREHRKVQTELFCRVVSRLHGEFMTWCNLGRLKSFLDRTQIKSTLDELSHDIHYGANSPRKPSLNNSDSGAREQDELRFVLQKIVENPNDMKNLLILGSSSIEDLMGCLQSELSSDDLETTQKQIFQHGLWFLYQASTKLPPNSDLNGQIELLDRYPISESRWSKAYSGKWLNEETVVILRPRSSIAMPNEFKKWTTYARNLFHPNVAQIYGHANVDGELCLIQQHPGEPLSLLRMQSLPAISRMRVLIDVINGLEYLHSNQITHGDICLANTSLSPRSDALLSGLLMGLPESQPEVRPCLDGPEMINRGPHSKSAHSDVWSFGVLCWEVLTGKQQSTKSIDNTPVLSGNNDLILPDKAGQHTFTPNVRDALSSLTRQCLHPDWQSRPSMTYVKEEMVKLGAIMEEEVGLPTSLSRTAPPTENEYSLQSSGQYNDNRPKSPLPASPRASPPRRRLSHSINSNFRALSIRSSIDSGISPPSYYSSSQDFTSGSPTSSMPISPTSPQIATPVSARSTEATLLEAITNTKSIIHLDEHGLPRCATLQGLIDHLIREFDTGADTVYREIFFTGCSDFTTSEDMFMTLSHRFEEVVKDKTYRLQCPRKSILMIIGYWLEEPNYHISEDLLGAMKHMGKMACSQKHCNEEQSIAQAIIRRVEDRLTRQAQASMLPVTPGRKLLRTSDVTPRDLAIALTLLEGDRYKAILPADYISHLLDKPTPNNVKAAYLTNNKIVLWVKQSVLHYDNIAARAQVFKFFINVAVECQALHNFASLTAIANGLNSAPIERLRLTKKELSLPLRESLHALDQLLNPEANHRAYRDELKNPSIAGQRNIGIPWIAVHLRELYSALQTNPPTVRLDGVPLINFRRYIKFTERIKQVLHYTPPDLEHHRHHGYLAYVEHQLRSVHLDAQNDDDLMARSLALEAGESRDYKARKRELKRLGFRA